MRIINQLVEKYIKHFTDKFHLSINKGDKFGTIRVFWYNIHFNEEYFVRILVVCIHGVISQQFLRLQ